MSEHEAEKRRRYQHRDGSVCLWFHMHEPMPDGRTYCHSRREYVGPWVDVAVSS